jgi:hypothetical protein
MSSLVVLPRLEAWLTGLRWAARRLFRSTRKCPYPGGSRIESVKSGSVASPSSVLDERLECLAIDCLSLAVFAKILVDSPGKLAKVPSVRKLV